VVLLAALAIAQCAPLLLPRLSGRSHGDVPFPPRVGFASVSLLLGLVAWQHVGARRLRLDTFQMISIGVLGAGALGALLASVMYAYYEPNAADPMIPLNRGFAVIIGTLSGFFQSGIWVATSVFGSMREDHQRRADEVARLQAEANELRLSAELSRLRRQLEPHFLLNTLNTIGGMIAINADTARQLLATLGELLRSALDEDDGHHRSVEAEISWMRRYAEILEARHVGALQFSWDLSTSVLHAKMPHLLLQPLVENAVKHGALRKRGGGQVRIEISRITDDLERTGWLRCVVEDNGPGSATGFAREGAIGLESVRRRLALEHAGAHLRVGHTEKGTRVVVELPDAARRDVAGREQR
jgi:LytS/YehU family sensor histidine kinase